MHFQLAKWIKGKGKGKMGQRSDFSGFIERAEASHFDYRGQPGAFNMRPLTKGETAAAESFLIARRALDKTGLIPSSFPHGGGHWTTLSGDEIPTA